jgi:hypothetical protein
MRNLERIIFEVQKNVTNILLNAFTKQRKKHYEKTMKSNTKPFYYCNEETGQLAKEKREKYLKWISSKDPQDRIELRRMQGKIRKMITEEKNKSWEKTCSTVESYLGGKRSTEAWRILKNLRKNENVGQLFNPIPIDKWQT